MSSRPGMGGPKRRLSTGHLFLILAVIFSVITIFVFKSMLGSKGPVKVAEDVKAKTVIVAKEQLYAGEIITSESLDTVEWPEKLFPKGDIYIDTSKLIGRAVKTDIYPGEPIYKGNLAGESSGGGMPVVIPSGYRAMTILVTENKGVGGFVKPGDHVDVLGTFEYKISDAAQKELAKKHVMTEDNFQWSQTVLQDVQVLAIAQEMYEKKSLLEEGTTSPSPANPPVGGSAPASTNTPEMVKAKVVSSITLAVTPEQAEKLAFADSRGDLRLSLRPENEHEQAHLLGVVSEDVTPLRNLFEKFTQGFSMPGFSDSSFGDDAAATAPALPPAPAPVASSMGGSKEVKIIKGTEMTSESF